MEPLAFHSLGTFCVKTSPVSSEGGDAMRIGNSSFVVVLAAMPRGVACAIELRYIREGSGVAPGAKTFFIVLLGMLGENVEAGGLSVIVDARNMFRAVAMELLLRLLAGTSSRVVNSFFADEACGVPRRFADELPKGEATEYARFAKGSGGRDRGVPLVAASTTSSPGIEKVTIL